MTRWHAGGRALTASAQISQYHKGCVYHFVMKLSHSLIAAALTSTLVLSACSNDDQPDDTATSTTEDGSGASGGASGDGADATGDAADQTGDTADETGDVADQTGDTAGETEDAAGETDDAGADEALTAALGIDEADTWAKDLLTTAMESTQLDGKEATELREKAFAGAELEAQRAAGLLEAVTGKPAEWDAEESPIDFQVLAISKSGERGPGLVLVQSIPEEGNPVLSLIARQKDREQFRIVWQGQMLSGTSIGEFERRSVGSGKFMLEEDEGLVASPKEVLDDLAEYLSFPHEGESPDIKTNGYAPAVREQAQQQANDVSVQADFTQTHELGDQQVHTLELADGSALTFAVLDRTSVFDVYDGMELTPPDSFWYFTRDRSITEEATLHTSAFVALHIPTDGQPEVIAAREQIVDSEGD